MRYRGGRGAAWVCRASLGGLLLLGQAGCSGPEFVPADPDAVGGDNGSGAASSSPGVGGSGGAGASGVTSSSGGAASNGGGPTASGGGPACSAGSACVPEAPAGWTGPAHFFEDAQEPPACAADFSDAIDGNTGTPSGSVTCQPCTCGAPTGQTCTVPAIAKYGQLLCGGASTGTLALPSGGACVNVTTESLQVGISTMFGGACVADGGTATLAPPSWAQQARVCHGLPALESCGAGVCMPEPQAGYRGACIYREGAVDACPAGFPEQTVVYQGLGDTRDCSACACDSPEGTCVDLVTHYAATGCSGAAKVVQANGCGSGNAIGPIKSAQFTAEPSGATCAATGGEAMGALAGTSPITVCCAR